MAAQISLMLLGRMVKSCEVYYGIPDATGELQWTLVGDMGLLNGIGSFESFTTTPANQPVEVSPGDSPATMNLPDQQDFSGSITEQRQSDGLAITQIAANSGKYIGIEATYEPDGAEGSGSLVKAAAIGLITTQPRSMQKGKNTMTTSFVSIGYAPFEGTGALPSYFPSGS